ncbi:hypothetical protein ACJMK2_002679 [Sinanodonta woodiana]
MMARSPLRDFTKKDDFSDVTLIVEDTKLYVHKQYLAEWSPVWRQKFLSDFSEETDTEISLPGKKLEEVTELLHCIYSTQKPISESNVRFLLELAHEYEMSSIKQRCEEYLISNEKSLEILVLAQKFNLKNMYKAGIEFAKTCTLEELEHSPEYRNLKPETLIAIYKDKITMMRNYASDLKQSEKNLTLKTNQLSVEKENMKSVLSHIQNIWETPNKRCYKHVNEDSFDFECQDCNEKISREIRKMCAEGQHVKYYRLNNNV